MSIKWRQLIQAIYVQTVYQYLWNYLITYPSHCQPPHTADYILSHFQNSGDALQEKNGISGRAPFLSTVSSQMHAEACIKNSKRKTFKRHVFRDSGTSSKIRDVWFHWASQIPNTTGPTWQLCVFDLLLPSTHLPPTLTCTDNTFCTGSQQQTAGRSQSKLSIT